MAAEQAAPAPTPTPQPAEPAPTPQPQGQAAPTEQAPAEGQGQQSGQTQQRYAQVAAAYAKKDLEAKKLAKQLKEAQEQAKRAQELEERLTKDPWTLLEEKGHSYDKWTQRVLQGKSKARQGQQGGEEDDERTAALKKELEEIKSKLGEREQTEQEQRQQQEHQKAVQTLTEQMEQIPELAFTAKLGVAPVVLSKIQKHAEEYGEQPSPQQQMTYARETEQELRATVKKQLAALSGVDGFQEMLREALGDGQSPREDEASQPGSNGIAAAATKPKPKPRTLTNAQAADVGTRSTGSRSEAERMQAALARLQGKQP